MDKYLNEDAITAEIMSYVKNRIYNYAVLIDGDWGTGKTYFIQKSIIPTLEGSGYMPIYISLYGVNSTDTVSQKIALSILTNKLPSDKRTVAKQCLPAIGSLVLPIGQTLLNATGISILEPLFKFCRIFLFVLRQILRRISSESKVDRRNRGIAIGRRCAKLQGRSILKIKVSAK